MTAPGSTLAVPLSPLHTHGMNRPGNPFPGMNPYLEQVWPGVHARLIGYVSDALAATLPDDLTVRPEESLAVVTLDGDKAYRADVAVSESWRRGIPPSWEPETAATGVALAEPVIVMGESEISRWVEIRTATGELVTVIEILSPYNKGTGSRDYRTKQQRLIHGGVNFVEIDLLRGGEHVLAAPRHLLPPRSAGAGGNICVTRSGTPNTHEVYPCPLRERLPAFRVPLRPSDADAPLDLQPLLDRCFVTGNYWKHDYSRALLPPLEPDDAAWVRELLTAAGLAN